MWSPKHRRDVLRGEIQQRVRELFQDIAEQYDITIMFPSDHLGLGSEGLQMSEIRHGEFIAIDKLENNQAKYIAND